MLTDNDTKNWRFEYVESSKFGRMTTQDCVVSFRVDDDRVTLYRVESANPYDPFGQADVEAIAEIAARYLDNWWRPRVDRRAASKSVKVTVQQR